MSELLSVGLDIGTTTSSLVVSRLQVRNQASSFAVPNLEITDREILYESPVIFTPLLSGELVDGNALRQWAEREYEAAGIRPGDVDTGAVIITGETSRKENARTVLRELSELAGEFVVATAGPDLESVLAAKGSGAVDWSEKTGSRVLHMDIGGGTSNLALVENGTITAVFCLNVGGRLVKIEGGRVSYLSPVVAGLTDLQIGDIPTQAQLTALTERLTEALEMAAGLRERTALFDKLTTREVAGGWTPPGETVLSFSGGVADCIQKDLPWDSYGDLGPLLGRAIRKSCLCQGAYRLGSQTIRATVIGAGCHSTQLSGSTVFYQNVALPVKNLPVMAVEPGRLPRQLEEPTVLAFRGYAAPGYSQVTALAEELAGIQTGQLFVALEQDMAKALGHALSLRLPAGSPVLCIDRVQFQAGSYLDIGQPVGPALPVVIKTLVLER